MAVLACGDSESTADRSESCACVDTTRASIVVDVRDRITGQPAASGSLLTIREGAFVDTVRGEIFKPAPLPPTAFLNWFHQRPGTYDLTIEKPGYEVWTKCGVQLERDQCCKSWFAQVDARLSPLAR